MARTPHNSPEAERIFNQNNVANRLAAPSAAMPDAGMNELIQEMQARLTNPNNDPYSRKNLNNGG